MFFIVKLLYIYTIVINQKIKIKIMKELKELLIKLMNNEKSNINVNVNDILIKFFNEYYLIEEKEDLLEMLKFSIKNHNIKYQKFII